MAHTGTRRRCLWAIYTQYIKKNDNRQEEAEWRTKMHEVSNHYIVWTNWINKLQSKTTSLLWSYLLSQTEYTQVDKFWSTRFLIAHIYLTWRVRLQRQTWPPALVQKKKKGGGEGRIKKCYRATGVKCYTALFRLWAGKIRLLKNSSMADWVQQYCLKHHCVWH